MRYSLIKIASTFIILSAALAGLLWTSLQDGTAYFKHVDEVMADPGQWAGRSMQLHGFVVPGSILRLPESFAYRFKIEHNGSVVDASYEGIVPDTFTDQSEVVLSGRLIANSGSDSAANAYGFHTNRDGIMAKCPSKYDAVTGPKVRPASRQES